MAFPTVAAEQRCGIFYNIDNATSPASPFVCDHVSGSDLTRSTDEGQARSNGVPADKTSVGAFVNSHNPGVGPTATCAVVPVAEGRQAQGVVVKRFPLPVFPPPSFSSAKHIMPRSTVQASASSSSFSNRSNALSSGVMAQPCGFKYSNVNIC
ncbi:unnamed protein product [Amoebophrya sp. A25]|nr:unnamed protein product [Amoebophrya sp. A25]|eukprot:GSA25T00013614001.1